MLDRIYTALITYVYGGCLVAAYLVYQLANWRDSASEMSGSSDNVIDELRLLVQDLADAIS